MHIKSRGYIPLPYIDLILFFIQKRDIIKFKFRVFHCFIYRLQKQYALYLINVYNSVGILSRP